MTKEENERRCYERVNDFMLKIEKDYQEVIKQKTHEGAIMDGDHWKIVHKHLAQLHDDLLKFLGESEDLEEIGRDVANGKFNPLDPYN